MHVRLRSALLAFGASLAILAQPAAGDGPQTIRMKGSDSIDPMVRLWIQEFQRDRPDIRFTVESKGSGTAPTALLQGEADIGHMSRSMNEKEVSAFTARFGHPPTDLVVAFDALAIYVNWRNPIPQLTIRQLDAIYGSTRLTGAERPIEGWWDLDVRPAKVWRYWVRPYSRDENSGSRAFFMDHVLQKGGVFKEKVRIKDQMGILEAVGRDLNAIGYGPESYRNPSVRMVPLAGLSSKQPCLPTLENIQSGRYPLSRSLHFYVDRRPGEELPPATRAFLEFVLSQRGQSIARGYGAAPLSPSMAEAEQAKLQ